MALGKWGDCVPTGLAPSGAALRASGFDGMFGYVGTPDLPKNLTAALYADWTAAGLAVAGVYERWADDAAGGYYAGTRAATAALVDMGRLGMPPTTPAAVTVDEHLTPQQLAEAVDYVTGFRDAVRAGWRGPVVAYGFGELAQAVVNAGAADLIWQCGAESALWRGATWWQDNTQTESVDGVTVDIDWQLLPLTTATGTDDMAVQTYPFEPTGVPDAQGNVTARRHVFGCETDSMSAVAQAAWCWVKCGWGPMRSVRIIAIGDALTPGGPARYLADQTWTNVRPDAERCLMPAPDGADQFSLEIVSEYHYTVTLATKPK